MEQLNKYKKIKLFGNLTTPFGAKTKDEQKHMGIDIAAPTGTPIPAFEDGTIISEGTKTNGLGNVVILKDKNGNTHQYGHLSSFSVKPGTVVKKGQTIAKMGSSGNSYSPSGGDPSHLDIRIADKFGKWKNPTKYISK